MDRKADLSSSGVQSGLTPRTSKAIEVEKGTSSLYRQFSLNREEEEEEDKKRNGFLMGEIKVVVVVQGNNNNKQVGRLKGEF